MTDDERAAMVAAVEREVAKVMCVYGTGTCHYRECACDKADTSTAILAAIEPAIRADERARVVEEAAAVLDRMFVRCDQNQCGFAANPCEYADGFLEFRYDGDPAAAIRAALGVGG